MNDNFKISVIVPVYNVQKYLDNCIESIVNQSYNNLEIILVDDGSTDNSPQICDSWAFKDNRIKVIHKENGGASSARNAGIDAFTGNFIAFVDGDDYIDSDMYEVMLKQITENDADAAACGIVRESENGYKEFWGSDDAEVELYDNMTLLKKIGEANGILPVSPCNKLFKRNVVSQIRFDTRFKYAEDTLFNFMVGLNIRKMVVQNVTRYHYINNSSSASHKSFNLAKFDEHRVMDIIFEYAKFDKTLLNYCIKGDIVKSFRTIKRMMVSGNHTEYFNKIRKRILCQKYVILKSNLYSKATKLKTVLLWIAPNLYKIIIRVYGIAAEKKYNRLSGVE